MGYDALNVFLFNINEDVIKNINFCYKIPKIGTRTVKTGVCFSFYGENDGFLIIDQAEKFAQKYFKSRKYLTNYKFLDLFSYTTKKECKRLDEKLNKHIDTDNQFSGILWWPAFEHDEHSYFRIFYGQEQIKTPKIYLLDWNYFKNWADENKGRFKLLNAEVGSYSVEGHELQTKKIKFCLSWETNLIDENNKDCKYIYREGSWIKIDNNFAKETDDDYLSLADKYVENEIKLVWKKEWKTEKEFNKKISKEKKYILLDLKPVQFDYLRKLEIADLIWLSDKEKQQPIFFVKKITQSYQMSHLKQQLINSINAIHSQSELISKSLSQQTKQSINIKKTEKIIIAIVGKNNRTTPENNELPYLPFFAKLAMVDFFQKYTLRDDYNIWILKIFKE